jgi:hypothetical protein
VYTAAKTKTLQYPVDAICENPQSCQYTSERAKWSGKAKQGFDWEVAMRRMAVLAVAFAALLTVAQPVSAQDLASSLVGTWKLTSFARKEVATGKSAATYGEHPPGYAYYTKGGRFQIFVVAQDRKKNEKPEPSDAERIELFKSMFSWGGTYKVEGNKIVYSVDIAWVQSWIGSTRTYQAELAGNKLTVTTPPFKSTLDGQDVVVVTTYERAE